MDFNLHLNEETVQHAPTSEPQCVGPETTVRQTLSLLREKQTGSVMICQNERLVGIFTERDALRVIAKIASDPSQASLLERPVREVMTAPAVAFSPSDTMRAAISKMSEGGFRRLPIVDQQGRPTAELKVSGVLRYLVTHFPNVVYTLPPQPRQAAQNREGA